MNEVGMDTLNSNEEENKNECPTQLCKPEDTQKDVDSFQFNLQLSVNMDFEATDDESSDDDKLVIDEDAENKSWDSSSSERSNEIEDATDDELSKTSADDENPIVGLHGLIFKLRNDPIVENCNKKCDQGEVSPLPTPTVSLNGDTTVQGDEIKTKHEEFGKNNEENNTVHKRNKQTSSEKKLGTGNRRLKIGGGKRKRDDKAGACKQGNEDKIENGEGTSKFEETYRKNSEIIETNGLDSEKQTCRRKRTTLTSSQTRHLKAYFEKCRRPTRQKMETLATETGLSFRVVQVWFQNHRERERRLEKKRAEQKRNEQIAYGNVQITRKTFHRIPQPEVTEVNWNNTSYVPVRQDTLKLQPKSAVEGDKYSSLSPEGQEAKWGNNPIEKRQLPGWFNEEETWYQKDRSSFTAATLREARLLHTDVRNYDDNYYSSPLARLQEVQEESNGSITEENQSSFISDGNSWKCNPEDNRGSLYVISMKDKWKHPDNSQTFPESVFREEDKWKCNYRTDVGSSEVLDLTNEAVDLTNDRHDNDKWRYINSYPLSTDKWRHSTMQTSTYVPTQGMQTSTYVPTQDRWRQDNFYHFNTVSEDKWRNDEESDGVSLPPTPQQGSWNSHLEGNNGSPIFNAALPGDWRRSLYPPPRGFEDRWTGYAGNDFNYPLVMEPQEYKWGNGSVGYSPATAWSREQQEDKTKHSSLVAFIRAQKEKWKHSNKDKKSSSPTQDDGETCSSNISQAGSTSPSFPDLQKQNCEENRSMSVILRTEDAWKMNEESSCSSVSSVPPKEDNTNNDFEGNEKASAFPAQTQQGPWGYTSQNNYNRESVTDTWKYGTAENYCSSSFTATQEDTWVSPYPEGNKMPPAVFKTEEDKWNQYYCKENNITGMQQDKWRTYSGDMNSASTSLDTQEDKWKLCSKDNIVSPSLSTDQENWKFYTTSNNTSGSLVSEKVKWPADAEESESLVQDKWKYSSEHSGNAASCVGLQERWVGSIEEKGRDEWSTAAKQHEGDWKYRVDEHNTQKVDTDQGESTSPLLEDGCETQESKAKNIDQFYACSVCKKLTHVDFLESHDDLKVCSICIRSEDHVTNKELPLPSLNNNNTSNKPNGLNGIVCKACGKSFKRENNFYNHCMECHSNSRPFVCSICSDSFAMEKQLSCHMTQEHKEQQKRVCSVCNETFQSKIDLMKHLQLHASTTSHFCPECGKSFSRKSELAVHILCHRGNEVPHACLTCNQPFSSKEELKKHLKSHERRYVCAVCSYGFARKSGLYKHVLSHIGARPYFCFLCQKEIKWKKDFKPHLLMHCDIQSTPRRRFNCNDCNQSFAHKFRLSEHVLSHL